MVFLELSTSNQVNLSASTKKVISLTCDTARFRVRYIVQEYTTLQQ